MPRQPTAAFGAKALIAGLLTLLVSLYNQLQPAPAIEGLTPLKKYLHAFVSVAVTLLVIGGVLLMLGFNGGLYWVAAGVLISLAASVWTAWILLSEIVR
jgi:hypothetical protein